MAQDHSVLGLQLLISFLSTPLCSYSPKWCVQNSSFGPSFVRGDRVFFVCFSFFKFGHKLLVNYTLNLDFVLAFWIEKLYKNSKEIKRLLFGSLAKTLLHIDESLKTS